MIPDVAPGRHEVTVEKSGYTTTKQEFTLAAGQSLPLSLTAVPGVGGGPTTRRRARGVRDRRHRASPPSGEGTDAWRGPASGSPSSAPSPRPGWR